MFKSIKAWCLMLMLALILPALVKAEAPPPKNKNHVTYNVENFSPAQVFVISQDTYISSLGIMISPAINNKQASDIQPVLAVYRTNIKCAKATPKLAPGLFMPDKVGWRNYNI